jgi:hypothetical protein
MPSLSELQAAMTQALLAPAGPMRELPDAWFAGSATAGLRVHRNTVIGACCQALQLSYPTVARLLGTQLFDDLAAHFARLLPPAVPMLASYGENFAEFLGQRTAPEDRVLLQEMARYDWLFERVALSAAGDFQGTRVVTLDGGVHMQFAASLRLFKAYYRVDELRIGAADAAPLEAAQTLALWRKHDGVAVQVLSPPAAIWLRVLLQGGSSEAALQEASVLATTSDIASTIASEIFRASFVRLSVNQGNQQ